MTPQNIVNLANIMGYNAIALTDHNSCGNCEATMKAGERVGITVIPGMELCTAEEVHVVCLFPTIEKAMAFSDYIYSTLPPVKNKPSVFGEQTYRDEDDNVIGTEERLLITARAVNSEGGRIILLFGCGGDRDRSKRPRMGEIAVELADMALITSDNSRSEDALSIISDILDGIPKEKSNYAVIPDRREAIRYAVSIAKPTDIVLLAGKGHEKYEINKNGKLPFDEEYEVLRASELCKSDQGSTR
jgi:hypothetical protein